MKSLTAKLRKNPLARSALKVARGVKGKAVRSAAKMYRPMLWRKQKRASLTSRDLGLPQITCTNIFEFCNWEGVGAQLPIQILSARALNECPLPLTLEPNRHYELDRRAVAWDTEAYVFELAKGRIISPYQAVVTSHDVYLEDESYEFHSYNVWDRRFFAEQRNLPKVTSVAGTVAHIASYGDDGNIFHFIHNALPRLGLIQSSQWKDKIDKYYVSTDNFKFINSALDLLDIPESSRIYGNHVPHIEAERLIVSTRPERMGQLERWNFRIVRDLLLPKLGPLKPKEKIYVSRSTASQRRILNEDELMAALQPLGFRVVVMDKLSLKEQAETMRDASVVVGAHGANLTFINMIDPGTHFVEIFPRNFVVSCYYQLAAMAGATYSYVLDEGAPNPDLTNLLKYASDDIVVDVNKVLATLELCSKHNPI